MLVTRQKPVMQALKQNPNKEQLEAGFDLSRGLLRLGSTDIQVNGDIVLEDDGQQDRAQGLQTRGALQTAGGGMLGARGVAGRTVRDVQAAEAAGWQLGWTQIQLQEVNWAYYEGQTPAAGGALMRFDQPPARQPGMCRDSSGEGIMWFKGAMDKDEQGNIIDVSCAKVKGTERLPLRLESILGDAPVNEYDLQYRNGKTNAVNFLKVCEFRLLFCSVLTLQKVDRRYNSSYEYLRHFRWTVGGRYVVVAPKDGGSWMGNLVGEDDCRVFPPQNGRLDAECVKLLTNSGAPHCNTVASLARMHRQVVESPNRFNPPAPLPLSK